MKMYLNVYPTASKNTYACAGGLYPSRETADLIAKPHRVDCIEVEVPYRVMELSMKKRESYNYEKSSRRKVKPNKVRPIHSSSKYW